MNLSQHTLQLMINSEFHTEFKQKRKMTLCQKSFESARVSKRSHQNCSLPHLTLWHWNGPDQFFVGNLFLSPHSLHKQSFNFQVALAFWQDNLVHNAEFESSVELALCTGHLNF